MHSQQVYYENVMETRSLLSAALLHFPWQGPSINSAKSKERDLSPVALEKYSGLLTFACHGKHHYIILPASSICLLHAPS